MSTHSIPASVRVSHGTRTPSIAPSFPQSPADKAAHESASWLSPAGREALRRAETATAKIRDEQFTAALNARGLAEYEQYASAAA